MTDRWEEQHGPVPPEADDELLMERQRDRGRKLDAADIVAELMSVHEATMRDLEDHATDPDEIDAQEFIGGREFPADE